MFRRFKVWRAEKDLVEAKHELFAWSHQSAELQEECMEFIVYAKRAAGECNWSNVCLDNETNKTLYKLFLHQQHTGYLVEIVRKKTHMLDRLKPGAATKLWEVGEDLGIRGSIAQHDLYKEFVKNILPRLEQVESEMFSQSRD